MNSQDMNSHELTSHGKKSRDLKSQGVKRYGIVVEQLRRPVPGGIGTYARGLLQGLNENARSTDLLKVDENDWRESFLLIASGSALKPDPLAELGAIWSPARGVPVGHRLIQRGWDNRLFAVPPGLDVVHATSFAQPPRRVSAKRSERLRTMYVHDLAWHTHPDAYPEAGRIWHERALARALREVDQFFVPSKATETALRLASRREIAVHVIAEGCDHLPLAAPSEHHEGVVLKNGVVREAGYLLTVSTLEPRKNLARLLEAYARVRTELKTLDLPLLPLRIVGPKGWINANGNPTLPAELPEGVELLGAVDDYELVQQFLGAAAFVYVPVVEGFGLPPLEAMRAGIPVICSAVPSVAESTPPTACIVDPLQIDSITDGIIRVLTNSAFRNSLTAAGTALAAERTWIECAAQHLEHWRAAS